MNAVDLLAILFLVCWAVWGYKRGLIFTLADLSGFLLCIAAAVKIYPPIGLYLMNKLATTRGLANLGAFVGAFTLFHSAYMLLIIRLYRPLPAWFYVHHWKLKEKLLGIFPGLTAGVLWLTLILASLTWFPFSGSAKAAIGRSSIGRPLVERAAVIEPQVERLFGPAARDTIGFLTVRKYGEKKPVKIPKSANLSIDENAERRMLEKINEARTQVGLSPLVMDPALQNVARRHSEEMFRLGYFAHDSPNSGSPFDRMDKADIKYFMAGENLAYAQNVDLAHEGLMNSKPHRENILTPDFGKVGIGIIDGGVYGEMFTQDFTD
ncbi:MAG: CvpA family protein [Actinobacteria bacterium]|nr:CvpA family protein [Actinomycetota bacterium]